MKNYFKKVMTLIICLSILLGIPYLAGDWIWLFASWMPALTALVYLETA